MKYLLMLLPFIVLFGCSTTDIGMRTEVRTGIADVPAIEGETNAVWADSALFAYDTDPVTGDTVISYQYIPLLQGYDSAYVKTLLAQLHDLKGKLAYKVTPPPVKYTYIDTTMSATKYIRPSLGEMASFAGIVLAVAVGFFIIGKGFIKKAV